MDKTTAPMIDNCYPVSLIVERDANIWGKPSLKRIKKMKDMYTIGSPEPSVSLYSVMP